MLVLETSISLLVPLAAERSATANIRLFASWACLSSSLTEVVPCPNVGWCGESVGVGDGGGHRSWQVKDDDEIQRGRCARDLLLDQVAPLERQAQTWEDLTLRSFSGCVGMSCRVLNRDG